MKRVCVFCGSASGDDPAFGEAAARMGRALAGRGIGLVYGGGNVGLMGAVADAALSGGGEAIGVIPYALMAREVGHIHLTELQIVDSMHERKARMADLSDGFIAMPGGFGTFEEFFEIVTWAQLGMHDKPCGLLNTAGYYDPVLAMIESALAHGFIRPQYRPLVLVESEPEALLERMDAYAPPRLERWIDRRAT